MITSPTHEECQIKIVEGENPRCQLSNSHCPKIQDYNDIYDKLLIKI